MESLGETRSEGSELKQAAPGLSISGWQHQFLDAIAHLADRVEQHIERDRNTEPVEPDDL